MLNQQKYIVLSGSKEYFISTWKTDNTSAGSSTDHQVKLPLVATGVYDFTVYWGDGTNDTIRTWNQSEVTHTYADIDTYTIKIIGKCEGWQFNNAGDKLKLLTVEKWGKDFKLSVNGGHFFGCTNLAINATDILQLGTTTDLSQSFRACSGLTNETIQFSNTSNVTTMWAMFYNCANFNGLVSYIKTDSCVFLSDMFGECASFNQSVNHFITNNVTSMYAMFYHCAAFNQDISNFNIESVTNIQHMLNGATSWATANYDLFLIEIATNQNAVDSLTFHCSSNYTLGGAAAAARADLIATDLWTINDGGGV